MNKLEEIDNLLKDDISLEEYINNINKNQVDIPLDLKSNIMSKINKKKKIYYADICKIAACLIFSLSICRTDIIKNDNIIDYKDKQVKETTSIEKKVSDFCKWFTTPLEIEKEEK